MHAAQIVEVGGPDVLTYREVAAPAAGAGQVLVDVAAAGLNYLDTYHRSGLYEVALPAILGMEGSGVVAGLGEGVDSIQVGDRVAWTGAIGSYASQHVIAAESLAKVPDEVDLETAAAVMLQGLTAQYLVNDTWPLQAGQRCLLHAGAGGVGLLLIQMAKAKGAEVFATVGSDEKAVLASAAGADHVIVYSRDDFAQAVEAIAGPRAIDVVYDGVGRATFSGGISLLRKRGLMATFGNASGPVDPVSPLELSANGSLFLTRPSLFDYIATPAEFEAKTAALFDQVGSGALDVRIGKRLPLADAAKAHELLEARVTTGKVILIT